MTNAAALHEVLTAKVAAARARHEAAQSRRTECAYLDALAELAALEAKASEPLDK